MTQGSQEIYIATVALERTRWGRKECSFCVSEWLGRFAADGFDGVELWENHYLLADSEEQRRLAESGQIVIYNSYVGFDDDSADARATAAEAIARISPRGVKYNFGHKQELTEEYARNLMGWEKQIPERCVLLCECHGGTVLETIEAARTVFDPLDPDRFGLMVHCSSGASDSAKWLEVFGDRVKHIHVQLRDAESDPSTTEGGAGLRQGLSGLFAAGFRGSISVEFTRGIGKDEDIEVLYKNACTDLREIRAIMGELHEMGERDSC